MAHENLSREQGIEGSSDRSFGLVFAVVFLLIAAWPMWSGETIRWWAAGVASGFSIVAVVRPGMLAGPNQWWIKFGVLLGKLISPIALGILFYCIVMPIGVVIRLFGKDPLRLKFDSVARSYWIERKPPGPPPNSMKNQF